MACGAKLYQLAGVSTLIAIIVLVGLGYLEKAFARSEKKHEL
jgi:uncharacterized membrane protein YhiD involved in acid resistance